MMGHVALYGWKKKNNVSDQDCCMITLREVTKENFYECCNLKREVFDYVGNAESVLAEAYIYRDVATPYAIYLDDSIIGMVLMDTYVSDGVCEFTDLFIADDYRNKGLGESVVRNVIDYLLKKGAERIKITVNKANDKALHIYQKTGFVIEKTSEWDEDFVIMTYLSDH